MKKLLLTAAVLGSVLGATAQTPGTDVQEAKDVIMFCGPYANKISPNGNWLAGAIYEQAAVIDVAGKTIYMNEGTIEPGLGNCITDTGLIAFNMDQYGGTKPAYFKDGDWHQLPVETVAYVRCTSNDGKMIFGAMATPEGRLGEGIGMIPIVWIAGDNGFGNPVELPYPSTDFTGRAPQMICPISVSRDGKILYGQVCDYHGAVYQPIIWTLADDGTWSYKLLMGDRINPAGLTFPEWPGDSPAMPNYEDYFTPEQSEAYAAAINEWAMGGYDPFSYPDPKDFMSPEKKAEYEADMAAYEAVIGEWNVKFEAFQNVYYECRSNPNFKTLVMNAGTMSPKGDYVLASSGAAPYVIDSTTRIDLPAGTLTDVSYTTVESGVVYINEILEDGSLVGSIAGNAMFGIPDEAYVKTVDADKMVKLEDYIKSINPELRAWMDENMTHTLTDAWSGETTEKTFYGFPSGANNLQVLATTVFNSWGEVDDNGNLKDGYPSYTYWFTPTGDAGISDIATDAVKMTIKNGNIQLSDNVTLLDIYNMAGAKVYSVKNPGTEVNPGLGRGIYVIKAMGSKGVKTVLKTRL